MRVFVTGATGFIGSSIVRQLIEAGHQVVGLARSDAAAATLAERGVGVQRGDLTDLDSLVAGASDCDGVIHTGFIHDFTNFAASIATDKRALEAMVGALAGSGKPLVIASGTLMVSHARPATEQDRPFSLEAPRAASEELVRAAASNGVRSAVVRLPPPVHDIDRAGLITRMIPMARAAGVAAYVGEGANLWPAVHREDAARVFCLALEKATAGSNLHAVAEGGIPMRTIAEAIGKGLGVPVRSVTAEEAPAIFGPFAAFVVLDNPTTSEVTRDTLGWSPTQIGLIEDLENPAHYAV